MSWLSELLGVVGKVVTLEDYVTRLDASVVAMTEKLSDTRDRVICPEGLIEGAVRALAGVSDRELQTRVR